MRPLEGSILGAMLKTQGEIEGNPGEGWQKGEKV